MSQTASDRTPPSEGGMWAPYEPPEIGEPLDTLENVPAFVLLGAKVREGVKTEYGPRDAVDLVVQTTTVDVTRLFSGFAAGVVGQAKRITAGDLPAVCRIVKMPTGRGETRGLELVERVPAGADLPALARAQATPIAPIGNTDGIPY